MIASSITKNGALLAAFALVITFLILITDRITQPTIAVQQSKLIQARLNELVPVNSYNNDMIADCILVPSWNIQEQQHKVYRARRDQKPVALVLETIAPNGYNGKIHMLVGLNTNGIVTGVRVVDHKETPGLGDKIDLRIDDWILSFAGKSLTEKAESQWKVKKDGGQFDQFTGATITPRAVVGTVFDTLRFSTQNMSTLFGAPSSCQN